MHGVAGQWFKPFALTIACAVLVSLFVVVLARPDALGLLAGSARRRRTDKAWITRLLDRFNAVVRAGWPTGITRCIGWALDHRLAMAAIATASFFGAIVLQATFGGAGFVPVSDRSEVSIIVETPPGSNLDLHLDQGRRGGADRPHATPRSPTPIPRWATPLPMRTPGVDQAQVYVKLVPKSDRHLSQDALGRLLRAEMAAGRRRDDFGVHQRIWRRHQADPGSAVAAPMPGR